MTQPRKVVIPAAGLGTRFLPVTKSIPKEMLPILDKAAIQYIIEEAANADFEQAIIITSQGKESIHRYFERDYNLEAILSDRGDDLKVQNLRELSNIMKISYVLQPEQLGLGHAILCAAEIVGNEPFAVILPDDIILSDSSGIARLIKAFHQYHTSIVAVDEVEECEISNYGVISPKYLGNQIYKILGTVEKPKPKDAPSNLGIVGRYILTPGIFKALTEARPGKSGELQLTDALDILLKTEPIYAVNIDGIRHDVGNPIGMLKASIELALQREDIGPELKTFLKTILQ